LEKVEFLKTLIRDITADERKSWADYAKMFEGGKDSEYPRSIWKRFKNQFYKDGLWTPGVPIDTIWREQVDTVMSGLEITPRAEDNEVVMTALKPNGQIMSIQEYCDTYNIPVEQVKSCKLVTHNGKGAYYNIQSINLNLDETNIFNKEILDAFDNILERYTPGVKIFEKAPINTDNPRALKVTISDSHVGLDPNPKGSGGIFLYEYNADVYKKGMEKVFNAVIKEFNTYKEPFSVLLLDDLGDREDGWSGQTTRGTGLPQNMTNGEVFDTLVDTNVRLVESLVDAKVANKIILRTISNSNHSHDFALIVNKAIQKIINRLYSQEIVEVDILEKFIEHRVWGDHCFILTHGKDSINQKHGFPLMLDHKTINFINDYIDHYEIDSKYIHLEKGDLHQISYQKTRKFDYRNFMSFAPPSSWQQGNFGDSYAGFSIQVIEKYSNETSHTDYFLQHKKKK